MGVYPDQVHLKGTVWVNTRIRYTLKLVPSSRSGDGVSREGLNFSWAAFHDFRVRYVNVPAIP